MNGVKVLDIAPDVDDDARQRADEAHVERLLKTYHVDPPMTSTEFDDTEFSVDYHIEGVFPKMQSTIIAGGPKGMKTTVSIDAALSLGIDIDQTGFGPDNRFLGRFCVSDPQRVLVCSAESGEGTIQETARRIAKSKGFSLRDAGENVCWEFWVPQAKNSEQIAILRHFITKHRPTVVIIDPLYQCLDGDDMSNVSKNGQQIMDLAKACLDLDCTPVMVDHVKRSSENAKNYMPLELFDVTGAGKAEAFRSWLLLGRREKFNPEHQLHRLWVTIGGSAGHCGAYALDIDESRDDDGKRQYMVDTMYASEAIASEQEDRRRQKALEKEQRDTERIEASMRKIRKTLPKDSVWSKSQLRTAAGLNKDAADSAIAELVSRCELEVKRHKNETGPWFDGLKWTENATHLRAKTPNPDNPDKTQTEPGQSGFEQ